MPTVAPEAVLTIDQGTTNSKAVLVGPTGEVLGRGSAPLAVSSPRPGWVEQDPGTIWTSVVDAVVRCLKSAPAGTRVQAVGLSTQRESVLGWDEHGVPTGPLLGWQDRRTSDWCTANISGEQARLVRERTGLQPDAMFSAPKMRWLLDHQTAGRAHDRLRLGTVDSWLLWNLTGGRVHACDAGNASRTLLFDVVELSWNTELCDVFGIPMNALPSVQRSDGGFGATVGIPGVPDGTPILAVMADSHAALFGQGCTEPGLGKATYGTGTSVMTPVAAFSSRTSAVSPTLAWLTDRPTYAFEGNILSSGAALAWTAAMLTNGQVGDLVALAETAIDSAGVTLVPALSGLGAPHWDREATAVFSGMSVGTTRAHLARAAVDAVAHQVCDIVDVIDAESTPLRSLRADGGATVSDLVMQTQADLLGRPVEVAEVAEVSALGVARLAWEHLRPSDEWPDPGHAVRRTFDPRISEAERATRRDAWSAEILRSTFRPVPREVATPSSVGTGTVSPVTSPEGGSR